MKNLFVIQSDALGARADQIIDEFTRIETEQAALDARRVRCLAEAARIADAHAALWHSGTVATSRESERHLIATELGLATRRSVRTVTRMMNTAETLVHDLPATLTALEQGRVSYRHAEHMVTHAITLPVEARGAFEDTLLPDAEQLPPARFGEKARQARELTHPESITTRNKTAREERNVFVAPECDGMAMLTALLPAEDAIGIDDLIDRVARSHRGDNDGRTQVQRRADAFVDLMLRPTAADDKVTAIVLVTVPATTIAGGDEPGHLHGYGLIDPDTSRAFAATAPTFLQILTRPGTTTPMRITRCWGTPSATGTRTTGPIGRDRYSASPDLRRVLAIEDETCRFPQCGRRANRCELDHTHDWAAGGTTTPDNLTYLCSKHHHMKHETGWSVTADSDRPRHLNWRSPRGRTYSTAPARAPSDAPQREVAPVGREVAPANG